MAIVKMVILPHHLICVLLTIRSFHLSKDAAVAVYGTKAAQFAQKMDDKISYHNAYIRQTGTDMPEVTNWKWEDLK
jgi:xylulose-5-phosphate/fructose-6-phosphate phosphoketolase